MVIEVTFGAAMAACRTGQQWQQVVQLLAAMGRSKLEPGSLGCKGGL